MRASPLDDLQDKVKAILSKVIPTSGVDKEELMEKNMSAQPED
jgi:hypothetical protein